MMRLEDDTTILYISNLIKEMGDDYREQGVLRLGELIIFSTNIVPHFYVMRYELCLDKTSIIESSMISAEDCLKKYQSKCIEDSKRLTMLNNIYRIKNL